MPVKDPKAERPDRDAERVAMERHSPGAKAEPPKALDLHEHEAPSSPSEVVRSTDVPRTPPKRDNFPDVEPVESDPALLARLQDPYGQRSGEASEPKMVVAMDAYGNKVPMPV